MRTIKYSPNTLGRDVKNPLIDLHPDDEAYYFQTLNSWLATISHHAQVKDEFVWTQLTKRRPKQLCKGRAGPNSVVSTVTGLMSNYVSNLGKYPQVRISKKATADIEFCSQFFAALEPNTHEMILFQPALFDQGGVEF